ncbi:MAG: hypothetical protein ACLUIQ_07090 [Dialister invisus]
MALMKEATGSYSATLSLFRECLPLLSLFLYSFIGKMKRSGRSGAYLPEIIDLSVYETMTAAFVRVSVPFISIIVVRRIKFLMYSLIYCSVFSMMVK